MKPEDFGAVVRQTPAIIPAFRLTNFFVPEKKDMGGRQNIYVRVWDGNGYRITDPTLRIKAVSFAGQKFYPLDKNGPNELGHGDVPMFAQDTYQISVVDGAGHESDVISGLHPRHPGYDFGHFLYILEFTLKPAMATPTLPPEREQMFREFRRWLDDGKNIIDELEKLG
jgi:hypothetical protein